MAKKAATKIGDNVSIGHRAIVHGCTIEADALIGMGASPGVSNMLALKAMQPLDSVETLYTGWGAGDSDDDDMGGPGEGRSFGAAVEHWVHQFTGTIRVRKDGEYRDAAPLETIEIEYPGIGRGRVYTLGHPEPVTFPRFRPEIRNSYNVMDFPPYIIAVLRHLGRKVDRGRLTVPQAARVIEDTFQKGLFKNCLTRASH